MAVYTWEAKTRIGETRTGEMEADSSDFVSQRLRSQQLQVIKVKRKATEIIIRMPGDTGVTPRDLMIFTRQFATMIDAGLPMVQCLDILGGQMENKDFKKIVMSVKASVESGSTLADALRKHPKVFNRLFVNLVEAGETGGILDTILTRLAEYIEKNTKLVKQVKGAMTYPALILGFSGIVTVVLLVFVIPVFEAMFKDFGQTLPAMTQFVVDISNWMQANIGTVMLSIGAVSVAGYLGLKSKTGRYLFDEFLLNAPAIGPLAKKIAVAKFTRTMGTMLASGVPILEALDIVAGTAGNAVIEEGLQTVRVKITEGKAMSQPLAQLKYFPPMVVQMIAVGESTGAMDTMLNKIADFYDDEVDTAIGTMMALIEPLIMAVLAIVLGGLVISMYLPVFSMAGSIGG